MYGQTLNRTGKGFKTAAGGTPDILRALNSEPKSYFIEELNQMTGIEPLLVSVILDQLHQDGLVDCSTSAKFSRIKALKNLQAVRLNAKGRQVLFG